MLDALHPRPLRILVLSTLYPNARQPRHGIFVEERVRCLMASANVQVRVVAPVPWFPSTHPRYGRYADFAGVPEREIRHGLSILHPRYAVIPRVGMTLAPRSMAFAAARTLKHLRAEGFDFDLIDAHYFYPDGVAAAYLSRQFKRPLLITARGTDVNAIGEYALPRRQIRAAAAQATALITVSNSLGARLVELGVPADKITTLPNGVDLARFAPVDRKAARARLGVGGPVWVAVGHLIERKGVHITLEALAGVPEATLLIVGDGPEEASLRRLANGLGVSDRAHFVGAVAHDELPSYYTAADALILPTRSEGMPNVVLEAMACGTAVIATAVDGIPEILTGLPQGMLLEKRTSAAVIDAWHTVEAKALGPGQRAARRKSAQRFSWSQTTAGQLELFERVLRAARGIGVSGSGQALRENVSTPGEFE